MYNIAICDDEKNICAYLETELESYFKTRKVRNNIDIYYTGEELLYKIKKSIFYDIVFLDIELCSISGITIAEYLREYMNNEITQIIYISSKQHYAMRLFQTRPFDFLLKPFSTEKINRVLAKVLDVLDKGNLVFKFQTKQTYYSIPYKNILYFHSIGRKVNVILSEEVLCFNSKLSKIIQQVPSTEFLYIHKSYIINNKYVLEYSYEWIKIKNGDILPISQANRTYIRKELLDIFTTDLS